TVRLRPLTRTVFTTPDVSVGAVGATARPVHPLPMATPTMAAATIQFRIPPPVTRGDSAERVPNRFAQKQEECAGGQEEGKKAITTRRRSPSYIRHRGRCAFRSS